MSRGRPLTPMWFLVNTHDQNNTFTFKELCSQLFSYNIFGHFAKMFSIFYFFKSATEKVTIVDYCDSCSLPPPSSTLLSFRIETPACLSKLGLWIIQPHLKNFPNYPFKYSLMIFVNQQTTMHISTSVAHTVYFVGPRRHPTCLANEIRLTTYGRFYREQVFRAQQCVCVSASASVHCTYGCRQRLATSVRDMGRLWDSRIIVAAYCSYSLRSQWIVPPYRDEHETHVQRASWNLGLSTDSWLNPSKFEDLREFRISQFFHYELE